MFIEIFNRGEITNYLLSFHTMPEDLIGELFNSNLKWERQPNIVKVKNFISLLLVLGLTVYTPVGYVYRYNTECLLVNTRDTHYPCPVGSIPTSVTNYKTCDFIQYIK